MSELWRGPLSGLYVVLSAEAKDRERKRDRAWSSRQLTNGVLVAMRGRPDLGGSGRMELRIARRGHIDEGMWAQELGALHEGMVMEVANGLVPAVMPGVLWWQLKEEDPAEGVTATRYLSLLVGEVRPGKALCWDCRYKKQQEVDEIDWVAGRGVSGQRCEEHERAAAVREGRRNEQGRLL